LLLLKIQIRKASFTRSTPAIVFFMLWIPLCIV
jgi:hypothetical protein